LPSELGQSAGGEQVHRPEVHEAAAWPGTGQLGEHLLAGNGAGHPIRHQPLLLGQPAVQPGLLRDEPCQPHRPPKVFAEQRVGLLAPGNRTATLHLDDDPAAVLVDLGGHLEQPTPPIRVLRAAHGAVGIVEAGPAPVTPHTLDIDAYRAQLLAAGALEPITQQRSHVTHPGSLVPSDRVWSASRERVAR
jgi:hypothetical protein